ncbi:hypothetical protein [Priestia endophytica]|uniref:hypothetical protein n=1 Tax=Priestia endophytica TaxID=135735 RepID=UPI00115D0FCB|nr:hypothetical protein [Priestia endophytica]
MLFDIQKYYMSRLLILTFFVNMSSKDRAINHASYIFITLKFVKYPPRPLGSVAYMLASPLSLSPIITKYSGDTFHDDEEETDYCGKY